MPEEKQKSLQPRWVLVWLWQWRWWIGLGTLFILVWWLVPPLLYRHTGADAAARLKAITDTRTGLLAGLVGVGALLTFWLNRRLFQITSQTAQITAKTFELTEHGQITERYSKAIEQLGDKELAVRLGGIYALEGIAHDSKEDRGYREHRTIVEVLSAFVREESKKPSQEAAETKTPAPKSDAAPEPATDVQAALTVLGRLPQRDDMSRGDLSGAQLSGVNLQMANLFRANFTEANLSDARLNGATLTRAQLRGTDLSNAWLFGAILPYAEFDKRTDFSGAVLFSADLSGAWLLEADLSDAGLEYADLSGAHLGGANLSHAEGLTQEQLDAARGNGKTQLPQGLQRPASWATGGKATAVSS